jgi:DNA-binding MarR family transcriptional regulator
MSVECTYMEWTMPSRKKVQNAHISDRLRDLHGAVLDIVSVMNRPQRDEAMIRAAGIRLDRALFPLLVGIERFGPIGVVELADCVGRDYTTVSRQVAKLEGLGLVERRGSAADRRVREATITLKGKMMTDMVGAARERIGRAIFETWDAHDLDELVRLMRKFANAIKAEEAIQENVGRPMFSWVDTPPKPAEKTSVSRRLMKAKKKER